MATGLLFGRACLDGGRLGVYVVNRLRLVDALRLGIAALMGRWKQDAVVEEYLGTELRIVDTPARVMGDERW